MACVSTRCAAKKYPRVPDTPPYALLYGYATRYGMYAFPFVWGHMTGEHA